MPSYLHVNATAVRGRVAWIDHQTPQRHCEEQKDDVSNELQKLASLLADSEANVFDRVQGVGLVQTLTVAD